MNLFKFLFGRMIEKHIEEYQADLMAKHYNEVQNMYHQVRGWRHDYHNHIHAMKAYISLGEIDKLDAYLTDLDTDLISVDTVIRTGNIMLDAILNSKLSNINNIKLNVKANVPQQINISEVDLCIITGNLLDNALEACNKQNVDEEKYIRVFIGILKKQLYISVTNSMGKEVKKIGKTYLSTKDSSHGYGLVRIDKIVKKYNGYINRQNEEGVFITEVMLPL